MVISSRRFPHTWLHACVTSQIGIKGVSNGPDCSLKNVHCHVFIIIALFLISSFLGGLLPTFKNPMVEPREIIFVLLLLFYANVSYMESSATRFTNFPDRNLRLTETPWISKAISADERHRFNLHQHILPVNKKKRKKECGAYLQFPTFRSIALEVKHVPHDLMTLYQYYNRKCLKIQPISGSVPKEVDMNQLLCFFNGMQR